MDSTKAFLDRDGFEAEVRDAQRELGSLAVQMGYELDYDSIGEPAVHFRIVLPDESFKDGKILSSARQVSSVIEDRLQHRLRWGVYPYYRYWSKSTYEAHPEPGWG